MSLPTKKRKFSDNESLPSIDMDSPRPVTKERTDSAAGVDSATSDDTAAMALRALSALDGHLKQSKNPLKQRKASVASSSGGSLLDDDHALGLAPLAEVASDAASAAPASAAQEDEESEAPTPPKSNIDGIASNKLSEAAPGKSTSSTALDHLDALGDDAVSLGSKHKVATAAAKLKASDDNVVIGVDEGSSLSGTLGSSNQQRALLEAFMTSSTISNKRRDRLESWGGMSDLSAAGFDHGRMDAATLASALHYTGLIEDVTAAANFSGAASLGSQNSLGLDPRAAAAVPSRISVSGAGDRKYSAASEDSLTHLLSDNCSFPRTQLLEAAMASVGDQLEELAGAVELAAGHSVASGSSDFLHQKRERTDSSDVSSTISPLIGQISDLADRGRPRSSSTSSKALYVDHDAVAAAVSAAEAATGALDLSQIANLVSSAVTSSNATSREVNPSATGPLHKSSTTEKDIEAMRARARATAGYVPPTSGNGPATPEPRPPLKKRSKQSDSQTIKSTQARVLQAARRTPIAPCPELTESTPRLTNVSSSRRPPSPCNDLRLPITTSAETEAANNKASSQKWDEMLLCLVQFREEQKAEALRGATQEEIDEWEWDGHVPTSYKTKDGKALGRWVNNQRSAKTKGNLKPEREDKLVDAGMRWSVVVESSWQDMMNELRLYVKEKTGKGEVWDGNVPTNYQIKGKRRGSEDKNLGRWVNRQRGTYQAGRLAADRQHQLEDLGLRWSVLSSTSWDAMYDILKMYAEKRKAEDPNNSWDGNVPASYKTNDGKALGRWVNRQRSAHTKGKLKKEFVDKLDGLGLKWSVHERRPFTSAPTDALERAPAPTAETSVISAPSAVVSDAIDANDVKQQEAV